MIRNPVNYGAYQIDPEPEQIDPETEHTGFAVDDQELSAALRLYSLATTFLESLPSLWSKAFLLLDERQRAVIIIEGLRKDDSHF